MSICTVAILDLTGMQTASSLTNLLFFLALHPEYQKLVQKELNELVVTGNTIPFSEIQKLPYLNAVWKESLRTATVPLGECHAPISKPGRALEIRDPACCNGGRYLERLFYSQRMHCHRQYWVSGLFPCGTRSILIFVGSFILKDPRIWGDDSNQFKPERFLTSDAKDLPDPTSTVFGFGRRFVS